MCGVVEALPYPDAHFDAVLNTLMLHHLPAKVREQCAHEMRRVSKPGGRVLAVDFEGSHHGTSVIRHVVEHVVELFHRKHGHVKTGELASTLA